MFEISSPFQVMDMDQFSSFLFFFFFFYMFVRLL